MELEMNERFQKLAEQAEKYADDNFKGENFWTQAYESKFAELIVRECVGVVEGGRFLHEQAPTAVFARECSGAIKRHFGVEE
jgi:hypothetical protein